MVLCSKCPEEATYDSPDNLCDVHWVEWWNEEIASSPEEEIELNAGTLENVKRLQKALTGFVQYNQLEKRKKTDGNL